MMDEGIHSIRGFTEKQFDDYMFSRSLYALKCLPTAKGCLPKPSKKDTAAEKLEYIACMMFCLGFSDGTKHFYTAYADKWGVSKEEIEGEPSEEAFTLSDIKYQLEGLNKTGLEKVLAFIYATRTDTNSVKNGGKNNARS